GPQSVEGVDELRGVELAAEWANHHLPAGARHINLATVASNRAEAVPAAMDALARRHVDVVVGSHGSNLSAVAAKVATERAMLFWETGAVGQTDDGVTGGASFIRMAPMGANLGEAAIGFVRD